VTFNKGVFNAFHTKFQAGISVVKGMALKPAFPVSGVEGCARVASPGAVVIQAVFSVAPLREGDELVLWTGL
jgi:hypothetical protein